MTTAEKPSRPLQEVSTTFRSDIRSSIIDESRRLAIRYKAGEITLSPLSQLSGGQALLTRDNLLCMGRVGEATYSLRFDTFALNIVGVIVRYDDPEVPHDYHPTSIVDDESAGTEAVLDLAHAWETAMSLSGE